MWVGMNLRDFVLSPQPRLPWRRILLAALGAALVLAVLGLVGTASGSMLLFVAFAPSCLLVCVLPEAPVSHPIAVVGGHGVSAAAGIVVGLLCPPEWWSFALSVGVAIAAMAALRVIHPPAVGTTVIALSTGAGWSFLLLPVLPAAFLIVVLGVIWHRFTGSRYPLPNPLRC